MKNTEKIKKKSLGFIFGFKESSNNNNVISIVFKSGISNKFPNKYKHTKDFWVEEIFVGQFSDIYINPKNFKKLFNIELNKLLEDESKKDFNFEHFQKSRYNFDYPISFEQYNYLNSFSMTNLYCNLHERWENDTVLKNTLKETMGSLFNTDKRDILDFYKEYQKVSQFIYEKEVDTELSESKIVIKKIKP